MPSVLIQQLDMGLNALVSNNMIDPRGAALGTENILYEYGIMRTPYGFAKIDLTTTGLTGAPVLSIVPYIESDRTSHVVAVTTQKLYDHNRSAEQWDDKTGTVLGADLFHPISYAEIAHNDTDVYLNDNTAQSLAYYHLVVCDGGMSNIQRWAGKYESTFRDVVGGGGYHDGTAHRALQVGAYKNRLILISPLEYNSASAIWVKNPQRVRWPTISKLQTWTGTGSGFVDLIDTGGKNTWSGLLGGSYVIYQNNSIWDLGYVGGATVFSPRPVMLSLGLLSGHLLVSKGNVHYFIGNDYNVYAYYGGSIKQSIGDKIHKFLQGDLDPAYEARCWMMMGEENKWLYIFIVPNGSVYITKAYIMNMATGAWSVRDFSNTFGSDNGITAVNLIGSETYINGDTYQAALNQISAYDAADNTSTTSGDTTKRYGDVLFDSTSNVLDWSTIDETLDFTQCEISDGGLLFCFTTTDGDATQLIDLTRHSDGTTYSGLIMRIDDGSDSGDMPNGSHYYTLTDISATADGTGYSVVVNVQPSESTGTGIADTSSDTPVLAADTTATLYCSSGNTYSNELNEVLVADRIMLGDATGFIYQLDEALTTEDTNSIVSRHLTPVIDLGEPGRFKRFNKISYTAKEKTSGNGGVKTRFRVGNFDTSETGWVDLTQTLTSDWEEYDTYINRSSKRVQFNWESVSGSDFEIREAELHFEPEGNR